MLCYATFIIQIAWILRIIHLLHYATLAHIAQLWQILHILQKSIISLYLRNWNKSTLAILLDLLLNCLINYQNTVVAKKKKEEKSCNEPLISLLNFWALHYFIILQIKNVIMSTVSNVLGVDDCRIIWKAK